MTNYTNTGNLMHLYLDEIQPGDLTHASNFLIKATANTLKEKGGRNWIPIIVKEIGEDSYQVIGNSFIYAVARQAGLERAWCIIADDNDDTVALTKILAGETFPKINLSTASRDDIAAALQYLIEQPGNPIKGIKLDVAVKRIDEAPRQFWQNFDPVINLKCGITKTKLDALKSVFHLTPQEPPIEPPTSETIPTLVTLKKMTVAQLKKMAKEKEIDITAKMKKADLIKVLSP